MARVNKVAIRRFKRVQELTLPLGDTTLLVGANNSGKSSILQAIHFAVSIAQSARLVGEGVAWALDNFELSFNPAQLIYSPVADVMSMASGGILQEPRESRIEIEFFHDDGNRSVVGLRRGRNRNIAVQISGRAIGETLMDFGSPYTVYAPGLAGVPKEERYMSAGAVRRIVARGDANLVLRNVLRMLSEDPARWDQFLDDMSSVFDRLYFRIDFNEQTDENIQVFFRLGDGPELPIDAAGTSILQTCQILAYVTLFRPKLLILDEPDSHLHPDNQRALCDLLHRLASERGFQALLCTHSRHMVDSMRGRASIVWLSKGAIVEGADVNTTSMLLDLGALDSVDYFTNGTVRALVATEDTGKEYIKALLWSSGFREDETEVVSYAGCSKVEAALVLAAFVREKAPNVAFIVHRDLDFLNADRIDDFKKELTQAGVKPFVTVSNDIQGYFLKPEHLANLNPGLTTSRAAELIDEATANTRNDSIEAIVNARTQEGFRLRSRGGPQPNVGEIAIRAMADFDASPATMRKGKKVLGNLSALVQQETKSNPRISFPSAHLVAPELRELARAIWPE